MRDIKFETSTVKCKKACPFCGGRELIMNVGFICDRLDNPKIKTWDAYIMCGHCAARGSYCGGGETKKVAMENAVRNWTVDSR